MSKMLSKLVLSLTAETSQFTKGMNKANQQLGLIRKEMATLSGAARVAQAALGGVALTVAGSALSGAVGQLIKLNDEYTSLTSRVKLATAVTGDYKNVMAGLVASSNQAGQAIAGNVELFQRLSFSRSDLKFNNEQILQLVETVGKLGKISGTLPDKLNDVTLQLGQLLGSPRAQADEFNRIMEGMPALIDVVARKFNTTGAGLKNLIKEGGVSGKAFADAILDSAKEVDEQFKTVKLTVADSMQVAQNNLMLTVGALDEATGASEILARGINFLAQGLTVLQNQLQNTDTDLAISARKFGALFTTLVDGSQLMYRGVMQAFADVSVVINNIVSEIARGAIRSIAVVNSMQKFAKIPTTGLEQVIKENRNASKLYKNQSYNYTQAALQDLKQIENAWEKVKSPGASRRSSGIKSTIQVFTGAGGGSGGKAGSTGSSRKGAGFSDANRELDRLKSQAETLRDSVRKPLEIYKENVAEADALLKKHLITLETYNRAVSKFQGEYGNALNLDALISKAGDKWMQPMLNGFDLVKDDFKAMADEVNRLADEAQNKLQKQLDDAKAVVEGTRSEFEKLREEITRLDGLAAVPGSPLDAATLLKAKQSAVDAFNAQNAGLNSLQNAVANYGKSFEDAFVNATLKGQFSFRDMALSIIEDIERMALRMLVIQPIVDNIGNGLAKLTGAHLTPGGTVQQGGGGFLGKLAGGFFKSLLPGFADGGHPPVGKPFVVGERGPEIMMMGRQSTVIPNEQAFAGAGGYSGGGGQTVTVYQTFNVQATDVGSFGAQLKQHSNYIGNIALGHVQYADNKRGRAGVMDRSR